MNNNYSGWNVFFLALIVTILGITLILVLPKIDRGITNQMEILKAIRELKATTVTPQPQLKPLYASCDSFYASAKWDGVARGYVEWRSVAGGRCIVTFMQEVKLVVRTNGILQVDGNRAREVVDWTTVKGTLFQFDFTPDQKNVLEYVPTLP